MRKEDKWVEKETILRGALFVADLLQNEFLWTPPCAQLDDVISSTIDKFVNEDILCNVNDDD